MRDQSPSPASSATPAPENATPPAQDLGPRGLPRPALEVTFNPYLDWTQLDGADSNRHYYFERRDPVAIQAAKARGFQICTDPNIQTGFELKPTDGAKEFADVVLMETRRDHWDRLEAMKLDQANRFRTRQTTAGDGSVMVESEVAHGGQPLTLFEESTPSRKVYSFPGNPLSKS